MTKDQEIEMLKEKLARVEAAAKENLADERRATSFAHTLLAMAKSERDKAYSQLADVLHILEQHRSWTGMCWEQLPVPVHAVEKIRSKIAQAEQQEAQGAQAGDEHENFEAWHRSVVAGEPPHEKYHDGSYVNQHVNRYWTGWSARAALATQPAMREVK